MPYMNGVSNPYAAVPINQLPAGSPEQALAQVADEFGNRDSQTSLSEVDSFLQSSGPQARAALANDIANITGTGNGGGGDPRLAALLPVVQQYFGGRSTYTNGGSVFVDLDSSNGLKFTFIGGPMTSTAELAINREQRTWGGQYQDVTEWNGTPEEVIEPINGTDSSSLTTAVDLGVRQMERQGWA